MRQALGAVNRPSSTSRTVSGVVLTRTPRLRRIVGDMLSMVGIRELESFPDAEGVIMRVRYGQRVSFILCEGGMHLREHLTIARFVRWSEASPYPAMPIITLGEHWTLPVLVEARDAGISEMISIPITMHGFMRRFVSALYQERPFVTSDTYRGPERRRRNDPAYGGPRRRELDHVPAVEEPKTVMSQSALSRLVGASAV